MSLARRLLLREATLLRVQAVQIADVVLVHILHRAASRLRGVDWPLLVASLPLVGARVAGGPIRTDVRLDLFDIAG